MLDFLEIKNFRCLRDVKVNFESDQTLLVGENDSGKTSIIDVLRILFDGKKLEVEDFSYGQTNILIKVKVNENIFLVQYNNENGNISKEVQLELYHDNLSSIKEKINNEDFNEENSIDELKNIAKQFNLSIRSNSRFDGLKSSLNTIIDEKLTESEPCYVDSNLPSLNIYILDGKHMEDISLFIDERYFKDKKNSIWDESINGDSTLEQFVKQSLNDHSASIKRTIDECGIKEKIKDFLPELSDIKIETSFNRKEIQIGVNVKMLDGDEEIYIKKKGDGTKRRITLALLGIDEENQALYVFDEVDTHLHVKAQRDLISKLSQIYNSGNQVILTSHSPFVINSVRPKQIRSIVNIDNSSSINSINSIENVDSILNSLGIENTYLFFAKRILLVEGKTEEIFIPALFEKCRNSTIYNNLIKIINVDGIRNIPGFSRALLELNNKDNIFILFDNDIDEDTQSIMDSLALNESNIYKVGDCEFEDSFAPETIYHAWKSYVEANNRRIGEQWTEENISNCKNDCISNRSKFSKELKNLNIGCREKLTKPRLAIALAEYCNLDDVSVEIRELLSKLTV